MTVSVSHAVRLDTLRHLQNAVRGWWVNGVPRSLAEGTYLRWLSEDSGVSIYLTAPEIASVYARFYR